jgi:tetratricopeptide (TPR) repeat protein
MLLLSPPAQAQQPTPGSLVFHRIEGRVQFKGPVNNVRVRILQRSGLIPVEEGYTRGEGQFTFNRVPEGEYVIETEATDEFAASSTTISVSPMNRNRPEIFRVFVQLQLKPAPGTVKPGVVTADVDLHVPKEAQKRYREGMKALASNAPERAVEELQAAVKIHPDYYAARLELGRELRHQKRFKEAAEVLEPLLQLAPRRDEPRVEYGITLLALNRPADAVPVLRAALELEETNWVPHLYLGIALVEKDAAEAERHLRRALELNETKAVNAYLSLAHLAAIKGERVFVIEYLQTYLKLAPDAPDAEQVRQLLERTRAHN